MESPSGGRHPIPCGEQGGDGDDGVDDDDDEDDKTRPVCRVDREEVSKDIELSWWILFASSWLMFSTHCSKISLPPCVTGWQTCGTHSDSNSM